MAVQDYELLLKVRADLMQAITGLKGLGDALGGTKVAADDVSESGGKTAASIDAIGESADQATARLKAMVAATSQQAQVQESVRSKTERAAAQSRTIVQNAEAEAAAFRRTQAAAVAYREAEAARAAAPAAAAAQVAAIDAQRVAMGKLASQIDPTISAMAKLDAQEQSLNAMRKAGVVGLDDYTRFQAVIDKNRASITEAGKAMHTFSLNSALARREIGRLGTDIVNGNWGRFDQTALTLANYSGLMSVAFSPLGLAIGAVVGSLGAFVVAAAQVAIEDDKLNKSIQQTGNFADTTTGQIDKMASGMATTKTSVGAARDILNQLVASGRVGGQALGALGQASVDMAELTGQSAEKATGEVLKMFDGTAASALKANEQYHFLTTSIYEQIKALEDEGDTQAAMDVAAEAFHRAAQLRIEQMNQSLSGLAKMWDSVKTSAGNAWERMKTGASVLLGSADDQTKLYALMGKKMSAQEGGTNTLGSSITSAVGTTNPLLAPLLQQGLSKVPGTRASWSDADEAELKALQDKIKAETQKADDDSTRAQINDNAVKADAGLDKLAASIDKAYDKKEKIKELNKYFTDLWAGADPNNAKLNNVQRFVGNDGSVSYSGGMYDTLLADINKKFDPKVKSTKGVDNAAATAQAELIKLLNDEQGAVDPVTKIWAKYNDTVEKATALAEKAAKGKGANVVAIHAERDAIIEVAAKVRDAALDKQVDKDRLAFEKLRDSLSGIKGVSFESMITDLDKLNKYLKEGTITAQEYQDVAGKVLNQNLGKLPTYKGIGAAVGGPFGELDKLDVQQKQLEDAYKKQLDALNQWHAKTLTSDETFNAKELELSKAHADALKQIDDSRTRVMLAGITGSLASAAEAIKQGFGAQSGAYRAAFAVSKAAAIAQATVNMYLDISQASAKGWPTNIPLIAAAIGEGMTILGGIRSISAGYSEGGYTGPGAKHQPAGIVHAGEGVLNQAEIAGLGGPAGFHKLRAAIQNGTLSTHGMAGYADGGMVDSPIVSTAGFAARNEPSYAMRGNASASGQGGSRNLRLITTLDPNAINDHLNSSEGEQVILQVLGRNRTTLKTLVSH
jgi:hypothetical protein